MLTVGQQHTPDFASPAQPTCFENFCSLRGVQDFRLQAKQGTAGSSSSEPPRWSNPAAQLPGRRRVREALQRVRREAPELLPDKDRQDNRTRI